MEAQINDAVSHVGACEVPSAGRKPAVTTARLAGLMEMTRTKYLDIEPKTFVRRPWWFSYNQKLLAQLNRFAELQFSRSLLSRLRGVPAALGLLKRKTWL